MISICDVKYLRRYEIDKIKTIQQSLQDRIPKCVHGFRFDCEHNHGQVVENPVVCYNTSGKQIDVIEMPERVSNVEFGGVNGKTLFITASTSVYMTDMKIKGAKF